MPSRLRRLGSREIGHPRRRLSATVWPRNPMPHEVDAIRFSFANTHRPTDRGFTRARDAGLGRSSGSPKLLVRFEKLRTKLDPLGTNLTPPAHFVGSHA